MMLSQTICAKELLKSNRRQSLACPGRFAFTGAKKGDSRAVFKNPASDYSIASLSGVHNFLFPPLPAGFSLSRPKKQNP